MTGSGPPTEPVSTGFAAVVLAGGAARRMGGADKPALPVGGRPMRDRVLAAVADATVRIVVGATGDLPTGVRGIRERPPGGGPVAATAAGVALIPEHRSEGGADPVDHTTVALLAADLPLLTTEAVGQLRTALVRAAGATADGAVYVDDAGRPQWLCGVWRLAPLRAALARLAARCDGVLTDTSMRALMAELAVTELTWRGTGPPPWFDCDTDDDLRRAEEWISMTTMDRWLVAACAELDLDPVEVDTARVLDLARDVAHHVLRPGAPVTAYLLGVAVGRGADPTVAAADLADLARRWPAKEGPADEV